MLTKDEVSDIQSLVNHLIECEKEFLKVERVLNDARYNLNITLMKLQQKKES